MNPLSSSSTLLLLVDKFAHSPPGPGEYMILESGEPMITELDLEMATET